MANGMDDLVDMDAYLGAQATNPQMAEWLESAGFGPQLTPEQQFMQYGADVFRPGRSRLREAFWEARQPLLQQWYLNMPSRLAAGQGTSFADFMTGGPSGGRTELATGDRLRSLAQQAALVGGLSPTQWTDYQDAPLTGGVIDPSVRMRLGNMSPQERTLWRYAYGTGEDAATNQLNLAYALAMQRPGGGSYGGMMQRAIGSALQEIQEQQSLRDPESNFLDWYLQRTAGAPGTGGVGFL